MTASSKQQSRGRRRRIYGWLTLALMALALALPFSGEVMVRLHTAEAAAMKDSGENPRADYWRQVREGDRGYTAASGPYTTNSLIQNGGQNWRQIRNGPVARYGGGLLLTVLVLILGYYTVRGRIRLEGGFSHQVIPRWSMASRVLHWYVAVLFILLALTGLSLLFGRALLIPLFGPAGFAAYADLAMNVHNYLGPAFVIGVIFVILAWMKDNIPKAHDWEWFKQGGGLLKKGVHPPAGRNNAGEKIFTFWTLATLGLVVSFTGLVMDFPIFEQTRETMQTANLVHAIGAILWTFFMIGHIYLAIGQEGTLEAMTRGYVDANWAKQHSSLWYESEKDKVIPRPAEDTKAARQQPG